MGWTSIHTDISRSSKEIIQEVFKNWETEKIKVEIIDICQVGNTVYTAHKTTDKLTGKEKVWAGVFLTERDSRDYHNFSYKDMDETYGPYECNCPEKILNKLTPTDNEFANNWRKQCKKIAKEKKELNKRIRELKKLPLLTKIKVSDGKNSMCEHKIYQGKDIYCIVEGQEYYLPKNIAKLGFEIENS